MKGYIYHITNTVNGKKYIGKTYNIENRISKHFYELKRNNHHSTKLQNSVNKYGIDKFEVSYEIKEIENDDELSILEMKEIEKYDSYHNGYNQTLGGEGTKTAIDFETSVLLYQILQRYNGINRYMARFFGCEHQVIDKIKTNSIYSKVDYDENQLKELIFKLELSDDNLVENYKFHNNKKLDEEKCFEILSIVEKTKGYEKSLCSVLGINSKAIYRLKKGLIYKEYIQKYNALTEEEKEKILKKTMKKYNLFTVKSNRQRNCVKNPLTQNQVNYILDNKDKKTRVEISADLNISEDRVGNVILGKSYKDLVANYYSIK